MSVSVYNKPEWIGKKFHMLTVHEPVHVTNKMGNMWYWNVRCDCGTEKGMRPIEIIDGHNVSCGCYVRTREVWNKSHGESHTRLHNIWLGMIGRCKPENAMALRYGKRGIKVCDEWKDYETFAAWARSNGYADNLTIERIDVNGNYEPGNCTWITLEKQARNRRTTHRVMYKGKEMSLAEACEIAGVPYKRAFNRIKQQGWTLDEALAERKNGVVHYKKKVCKCKGCGNEFISETVNRKYCSDRCYKDTKNAARRVSKE